MNLKKLTAAVLSLLCLTLTACAKTSDNTHENLTEETSSTVTEVMEAKTTAILTETTETSAETTVISTTRPTPETTFDENDEILVRGQEFAESYAKMYWDYLCGAAWEDYVNTPYFDFDNKSEDNYFEDDGIPFYKLLY